MIQDLISLIFLIGLSLIPRLSLLYFKGFEIFNADHAVMGLMAKHILEGKPMVYYYGQGYMGSLEAFVAAFIFLFRGMSIISVQFAPLVFFLGFLAVNFYLLKMIAGRETTFVANLLLAISPPALSQLSVTALGGYPETLFFGSLVTFGFFYYQKSPSVKTLFLTSLAAGIGFWVNNLIILYFFALGILAFLNQSSFKTMTFKKILLLENKRITRLLRIAGILIHLGILFFVIWNIVSFFTGSALHMGSLQIKMASPPFLIKKVKKIIYILIGEISVLYLFSREKPLIAKELKSIFPMAAGFVLGALPLILHSLLGGEGYRVIHGSGTILAREFPSQFWMVMGHGLVGGVLGLPLAYFNAWSWLIFAISMGLLLYFCLLLHRQSEASKSYFLFPLLLTITVLIVCLFSNLTADRYLIPIYFSISWMVAVSLTQIKKKNPFLAVLLLVFILGNNAYANYRFIQQLPDSRRVKIGHYSVLALLNEKGIRGGYAHYVISYVLTLESQEKIIFAPYRSPDRYPAYTRYVDGLERVAYVFNQDAPIVSSFQSGMDQNKISYEKNWVDPFWVFVIDRRAGTEKGKV